MKALVLAAGEGTRLRPLTADCPKPMLPIGGQPLLAQIVLLLKQHGVTDIAINLHYKPWSIVRYFGQGRRLGVQIHYSLEEELLGSAGAAKRLEWFFDEPFIVFYGDVYTDMDLSELIATHRQRGGLITMALYAVDNPTECGIVELDDHLRVLRFVEKPAADQVFSRLANAGVLLVEPEVLGLIPPDQRLDFGHDVFPMLLAKGQSLVGYPTEATVIDIGTPDNYLRAQEVAVRTSMGEKGGDCLHKSSTAAFRDVIRRFSGAVEEEAESASHLDWKNVRV
jgi:mannose-1-phosphate guanylyltransferase